MAADSRLAYASGLSRAFPNNEIAKQAEHKPYRSENYRCWAPHISLGNEKKARGGEQRRRAASSLGQEQSYAKSIRKQHSHPPNGLSACYFFRLIKRMEELGIEPKTSCTLRPSNDDEC